MCIYIEFDGDNVTPEISPTRNQKKNTQKIFWKSILSIVEMYTLLAKYISKFDDKTFTT